MKVVIAEQDADQYPIQPEHIDTRPEIHFWDAFGKMEREVSAKYIVRLCQKLGGWIPFTKDEIEAFYRECGLRDGFWFNGLDQSFVPLCGDGKYHVTHEFIEACHNVAPLAARKEAKE